MAILCVGTSAYRLVRVNSGRIVSDIQGHTHGDQSYELHYVLDGKGALETKEKTYALGADTVYVNGPGVWHRQRTNDVEPMSEICVHLQLEKKGDDPVSSLFNVTSFFCGDGDPALRALFQAVAEHHRENNVFSKEKEKCCIGQIVTTLSEMQAPVAAAAQRANMDDEKFYIIDVLFWYDYARLTLESLSDKLGISARQTQRILKRHYGKTFRQKKAEAQVEAALLMLRQGKTVNEVSLAVGYSDTPSFIRAFKSVCGVSPGKAKNMNDEKETKSGT
ncbi:MAG: AraC family transcriptional regulator [Clostridia bacterium]|nr:AraC family transcriptional regulator [Clostridia bacterium]